MNLKDCIALAQREADKSKLDMAVVNAPIETAEDQDGPHGPGPYGYCPLVAKPILFRFGLVERVIKPKGH